MGSFYEIFNDEIIFSIFQLGIVFFALFAIFKKECIRIKEGGSGPNIDRGEESMGYFYLANGAGAVLINQIISISTAYEGFKCYFSIVDLLILSYLCFLNPWWRNEIIRFMPKLSKESF